MKSSNLTLDYFRNRSVTDGSGCWNWTASRNPRGYGNMIVDGKTINSHRVVWVVANGKPIPKGMCACHTCDNPSCVNPSHIFIGTHKDNMRDMRAKGRGAGVNIPPGKKRRYRYLAPDGRMVSGQHLSQIRRRRSGKCIACGNHPICADSKVYCQRHYEENAVRLRELARSKRGCEKRRLACKSYNFVTPDGK